VSDVAKNDDDTPARVTKPARTKKRTDLPFRLHDGSRHLPPLMQVDGSRFGLDEGIVQPPSIEALWDWYELYGHAATDPDPSWGEVWSSATQLALHLIEEEHDAIAGRRVVELGCGLGIVGLVAATLGARTTFLVDKEPLALHVACSTAAVNGLRVAAAPDDAGALVAVVGDFFESSSAASTDAEPPHWTRRVGRPDVVVAADVLYADSRAMDALAATCAVLLRPSHGRAFVADPAKGRAYGARAAFVRACEDRGAVVTETPFPARVYEGPMLEPTVLLTVQF